MCLLPGLRLFIQFIRRHRAQSNQENIAIPIALISGLDEPASLESGMLYATRNIRVDTLIIRSPNTPDLCWNIHRNGSELDTVHR
ncbi:hypothetical protein F4814DRAFT_422708 [Daldinia grandis]|nr:hypothetical protein F4814DRAFT_422708 [Daldinia grandis]